MKKSFLLSLSIFILMSFAMAWAGEMLGVRDGKFAPCSNAPHCVSTQSDDASHRIEPFIYSVDKAAVRQALLQVIETLPGTKVIKAQEDYLHAEFRTAIMKFVDDFEAYLEPGQKIIHFRSSSRVGYFDFGINRARVEKIKRNLQAVLNHFPKTS